VSELHRFSPRLAEVQRRKKRLSKAERRERYAELKAKRVEWVKSGLVEHGLSPLESLQRIIDDATLRYLAEAKRNDELRAAGKRVSDAKERALAKEAAYYDMLALQYNIDDRRTRVEEGQAAAWIEVLSRVMRHPDINLSEAKIRKIAALIPAVAGEIEQEQDERHAADER
jgi:hypothetical protein